MRRVIAATVILTPMMILVIVVMLVQCGCESQGLQTVGFLSDYSHLSSVSETTLRYTNPKIKLGNYSKFIIDPVVVHFHSKAKGADISSKELAELRQYMYATIHNAVLDHYNVVRRAGPGVARIRVALTDIKKSSPAMNILPATKIAGIGLGGASMEAELIDSQTGEQIIAVIDSQEGKRLSLEGLSKWGDAKSVMDNWAQRFKERLDEAPGH